AESQDTSAAGGIEGSPLLEIPSMRGRLGVHYDGGVGGKLFLICDIELPIAGSSKAPGGVDEVLQHAEKLVLDAGLLNVDESHEQFSSERFKQFFSQYSIGVGSTGNLGLSIGIISAKLGFQVSVYMSSDAKQWKKDLL